MEADLGRDRHVQSPQAGRGWHVCRTATRPELAESSEMTAEPAHLEVKTKSLDFIINALGIPRRFRMGVVQ